MSRAGALDGTGARASGGFTLLELLVVLVLLGILAAVAAPRFAALRQPSLAEIGRGVVAELRGYRTLAMRSGRPVLADPALLPVPSGVAVVPEQGEAAGGGIVFLPDGRSSGGRLLLASGTEELRVVVDWMTGEVRLLR